MCASSGNREPQGTWVHCSPALLNSGVRCGATKRRPCECNPAGSHDHFLIEGTDDYARAFMVENDV